MAKWGKAATENTHGAREKRSPSGSRWVTKIKNAVAIGQRGGGGKGWRGGAAMLLRHPLRPGPMIGHLGSPLVVPRRESQSRGPRYATSPGATHPEAAESRS